MGKGNIFNTKTLTKIKNFKDAGSKLGYGFKRHLPYILELRFCVCLNSGIFSNSLGNSGFLFRLLHTILPLTKSIRKKYTLNIYFLDYINVYRG